MPDENPNDEPTTDDVPAGKPEESNAAHGDAEAAPDPDVPDDDGPAAQPETDEADTDSQAARERAAPGEPATDAPDSMALSSPASEDPSDAPHSDELLWTWPGRNTASESNVTVVGRMHVYYPERTITVPMDGDAALRAIAGWRYGRPRLWEDALDPIAAPGTVSWAALSLEGVLAMVWLPGLPPEARPERMTLDPSVG
jgi:hypothetical protein